MSRTGPGSLLILGALSACSATPADVTAHAKGNAAPGSVEPPAWVINDGRSTGEPWALHAVAQGSGDDQALFEAAQVALTATFTTFSNVFLETYARTFDAGTAEAQDVLDLVARASVQYLHPPKRIAVWTYPDSGLRYMLVRLELRPWLVKVSPAGRLSHVARWRTSYVARLALDRVAGETTAPQPPPWALNMSHTDDDPAVLYAVGMKSGIRNLGLLYKAADNQARAEMAVAFNIFTAKLMKDYAGSITAQDLEEPAEEAMVGAAVKSFSSGLLAGVEVVDHYKDAEQLTVFSLVRLPLGNMVEQLIATEGLSDGVKTRMAETMRSALEELRNERAATPRPQAR